MPKKSSSKKNAKKPPQAKAAKGVSKQQPSAPDQMTLEVAFSLFRQGQFPEAGAACEELLKHHPDDSPTLYLAAVNATNQGQAQQAHQYFSQALALTPENLQLLNDFGVFMKQHGHLEQAEGLYRRAITLQPDFFPAYSNLGNLYLHKKQFPQAKACLEKALSLDPNLPDAYISLGIVLLNEDNVRGCVQCCQKALSLRPNDANAYNVLGNAALKTHETEQARKFYEKALSLNPRQADIYNNLGNLHNALGEHEKAHQYFQTAIRIKPDYAEVYNNLGLLANTMGQLETAEKFYQQALTIRPALLDAHINLGITYQTRWEMDKARACYENAMKLAPNNTGARMRHLLTIPPFFNTTEEIAACRNQLMQDLTTLEGQPLHLKNPVTEVGGTPFYLAYHGLDEVALQARFGQLFEQALAHRKVKVPYHRNQKPLIGFVSAHLQPGHTIGKLNLETIARLSRDQFDVAVFHIGPVPDLTLDTPVTQYSLPAGDIPRACRTIAEAQPDVLFYTDIGMDSTSYFLAFNRLAPVQCVTWGHPMTTGCSEIDYFISSRLYETEQGQAHYLEKLVELDDLNTYYPRPEASSQTDSRFNRGHYGLDNVEHLYLCPQTLFKLHPEFDAILGGILRGDANGTLVLLEGAEPQWKTPLLKRFAKTMPDVLDRIRFVPKMSRQEFINLLALSDVMLDPIHFGGGNTSLEALAQGTPIVTLPSDYLRARLTYGFYKKMGLMDCVAATPEEYIQKAVKLGTDAAYHHDVKSRILAECHVLYDQANVVTELERFLHQAIETASASQPKAALV